MAVDPRMPVLIGVGQALQRSPDLDSLVEPVALMAQAGQEVLDDCGASAAVRDALDWLVVVQGAWPYRDPGRLVAGRLGARGARTGLTGNGGESPMTVVSQLAGQIAAGECEAAMVVGGEGIYSRRQLKKAGRPISLTLQGDDVAPDRRFGGKIDVGDEHDRSFGLAAPVTTYPMFEVALRHDLGRDPVEHQAALGRLYARFNEIAVANPHAWNRHPMTAEQIAAPTSDNRYIGYPYTLVMNSNWFTDQAAAVIVASAGWAISAGVPRDRMVFLHSATTAADTGSLGHRLDFHGSRSLRAAGPRAFELAGVGPAQLGHVDLYSCFPSAVEVAARELGLGFDRDLTVTGGMSFYGGPLNNYTTHAMAEMVLRLRDHAGEFGLVVGNGGYLSKHVVMVMSTDEPENGYRYESCQDDVDRLPRHTFRADLVGNASIETYTVMHEAGRPTEAILAVLDVDGVRSWARTGDHDVMAELMAHDACEWIGNVDTAHRFRI